MGPPAEGCPGPPGAACGAGDAALLRGARGVVLDVKLGFQRLLRSQRRSRVDLQGSSNVAGDSDAHLRIAHHP